MELVTNGEGRSWAEVPGIVLYPHSMQLDPGVLQHRNEESTAHPCQSYLACDVDLETFSGKPWPKSMLTAGTVT